MSLKFTISDFDLVRKIQGMKGFNRIAKEEVSTAATENIVWGQAFLQKYPPPPPNSSYKRTGTLGKRWNHEVRPMRGGVRATLANPTEYMPFVQDEREQAKIHKGRWPTIQMLGRVPMRLFRERFQEAFRRIGDRLFRNQ